MTQTPYEELMEDGAVQAGAVEGSAVQAGAVEGGGATVETGPTPIDAFDGSVRKQSTVESFRMLALSVDRLLAEHSLWSVAIISPRPGDGRSSTAEGLARGLAEIRPPTRLLRGDPFERPRSLIDRRRKRSRMIDLAAEPVGTPAFDIIDLGQEASPNPAAFLERTRTMVQEQIAQGRSLVIDTPPASTKNLAFALAQVAGAALYVAKSRGNTSDIHISVRRQLDLLDIPILGVVVNEV